MRIQTHCDLESGWAACTILGKIFIFPLIFVGWLGVFISSIWLAGVTEFGQWGGFLRFDESEENEETDSGSSEMDG